MNSIFAPIDRPPEDKQSPEEFLGKHGVLRFFSNPQGNRIATYYWPAETAAKGIIVLAHGHGGYLPFDFLSDQGPGLPLMYKDSWVQKMNHAGYSVVGCDNQGAGRSEGLRCYCSSFEEYVADVRYAAEHCCHSGVANYPTDAPKFMMGMSMGGMISVLAAMGSPDLFKGVILLAPMLSLEKLANSGSNVILKPVVDYLSWALPTLPLAKTQKNDKFPHLQKLFDSDPMNYVGMTRIRNASECLRITSWFMKHLEEVKFPFLVIHSEHDTMCDCDGSKALYMKASSADKTIRLVNNMWHILPKEEGADDLLLKDILPWIDHRAAAMEQ